MVAFGFLPQNFGTYEWWLCSKMIVVWVVGIVNPYLLFKNNFEPFPLSFSRDSTTVSPTTHPVEFPLPNIYRLQTKFAKVMFLQVSVCPWEWGVSGRGMGRAWQGVYMAGSVHGRGCMAGGMHGRGHAWQGACKAGGGHAGQGCVCGRGHACHAPPGRYYEIRSMSGRYSSYWNTYASYWNTFFL